MQLNQKWLNFKFNAKLKTNGRQEYFRQKFIIRIKYSFNFKLFESKSVSVLKKAIKD